MTTVAETIVAREIGACVSSLISTLAKGYGAEIRSGFAPNDRDLSDLIDQAFELSASTDDWEEAATQALWVKFDPARHADITPPSLDTEWWFHAEAPEDDWFNSAQEACEANDIEPYQWEVYEHWIVSDWMADRLTEAGEKVDKDFAGFCVWARTTTGQSISMDGCIHHICDQLHA